MTSSVFRIAALFLLSTTAVWAGAPPTGRDAFHQMDGFVGDALLLRTAGELPDFDEPEPDPNLPNAGAIGLFCGGIARHEISDFGKFTFKNLEITVDDGNNINVMDKDVLLKQIKSGDYSGYAQCLYATLDAMREYAK